VANFQKKHRTILQENYTKKLKDQPTVDKCEKHLRVMAERLKKSEEDIQYYQQVLANIQANDFKKPKSRIIKILNLIEFLNSFIET